MLAGIGQVVLADDPGRGLGGLAREFLELLAEARPALFEIGKLAAERRLARRVGGHLAGDAGEFLLQPVDPGVGRRQLFARRGQLVFLPILGVADRRAFGLEPCNRFAGIGPECGFAVDIPRDLGQARVDLPPRRVDALFLGLQRVAGQQQPLQRRRRLGFGLAQAGNRLAGFGLPGCRDAGQARHLGDPGLGFCHALGRRFALVHRLDPLPVQADRLGAADVIAQTAVAGGLAGLTLEALELFLQRGDHVVEPVQVGVRRAQPQFGLMTARMQAGDAGGLFQQMAAVGRLGADQGTDPALAHQPGRVRARIRVGEQGLDVPRPHLAAVDAVGRAAAAFDVARDVDLRRVVELRRRRPVGVVHGQRHLGQVARRPVVGAAEDDVVHFAAAQLPGRGLAHDPAQRLDQVRLAAAVGTDDAGQAGLDPQFGGIDEGFETGQPESGEMHLGSGSVRTCSAWRR